MERYQNIKKGTKTGLTLSIIFIILGILVSFYVIYMGVSMATTSRIIHGCLDFVLYLLIVLYTAIEYKRPHGNFLKAVFIVFAMSIIISSAIGGGEKTTISIIHTIFNCAGAIVIAYVAGRLNKIEKNKKLLLLSGILFLISYILRYLSGVVILAACLGGLTPFFTLFALGFGYTARYEEHKAAGLEDKANE